MLTLAKDNHLQLLHTLVIIYDYVFMQNYVLSLYIIVKSSFSRYVGEIANDSVYEKNNYITLA